MHGLSKRTLGGAQYFVAHFHQEEVSAEIKGWFDFVPDVKWSNKNRKSQTGFEAEGKTQMSNESDFLMEPLLL